MKNHINRTRINELSQRPLTTETDDLNGFIADLKDVGANPIETMRILINKLDVNLKQAKELTLNSPAWTAEKEKIQEFEDFVLDAWAQDADEVIEKDGEVILIFDLNKDREDKE